VGFPASHPDLAFSLSDPRLQDSHEDLVQQFLVLPSNATFKIAFPRPNPLTRNKVWCSSSNFFGPFADLAVLISGSSVFVTIPHNTNTKGRLLGALKLPMLDVIQLVRKAWSQCLYCLAWLESGRRV